MILRILAALFGFVFPLAGAALALFVSGVKPESPISGAFVAQFAGWGMVFGVGLLTFAFIPRRLLTKSSPLRLLCLVGLVLPLLAALYFIVVVAWPIKFLWLVVGVVAAMCANTLRSANATTPNNSSSRMEHY